MKNKELEREPERKIHQKFFLHFIHAILENAHVYDARLINESFY